MEIGKFKDRVAIETKSRIFRLYCELKKQYNPYDSITDYQVRETETKFIIGFIKGLENALRETKELLGENKENE